MPDLPIPKKDLDLLRRIINSKDSLTVSFQEDTEPAFVYDLKASECNFIVNHEYAEYYEVEVEKELIPAWDLWMPQSVKGNIRATKLGEYVSEYYEKDESRYKKSMNNATLALILSGISILISVGLLFIK